MKYRRYGRLVVDGSTPDDRRAYLTRAPEEWVWGLHLPRLWVIWLRGMERGK